MPDAQTAQGPGGGRSSSGAGLLRDAVPTADVREFPGLDALLAAAPASATRRTGARGLRRASWTTWSSVWIEPRYAQEPDAVPALLTPNPHDLCAAP